LHDQRLVFGTIVELTWQQDITLLYIAPPDNNNWQILHVPPYSSTIRTQKLLRETKKKVKGKAFPLQAWSGPEGSRKLRLSDFMTTAQHRPPLPPGNAPVRGWVHQKAILRSEGFYVNEKFQRHQLESNQLYCMTSVLYLEQSWSWICATS